MVQRRGHQRTYARPNTPGGLDHFAHALAGQLSLARRRRQALDALGPASGAGGIGHLHARRARRAIVGHLLRQPGRVVPLPPLQRARLGTHHQDHHLRRNGLTHLFQQVRLDQQHLGAGVTQDVPHLVRLEMPVDRAVVATGDLAGLDGVDKGHAVAQHQGNHITLLDTQPGQAAGQLPASLLDLIGTQPGAGKKQFCGHCYSLLCNR